MFRPEELRDPFIIDDWTVLWSDVPLSFDRLRFLDEGHNLLHHSAFSTGANGNRHYLLPEVAKVVQDEFPLAGWPHRLLRWQPCLRYPVLGFRMGVLHWLYLCRFWIFPPFCSVLFPEEARPRQSENQLGASRWYFDSAWTIPRLWR